MNTHKFQEAHRGSASTRSARATGSTGEGEGGHTIAFAVSTSLVLRTLQQLSEGPGVALCGGLVLFGRHGDGGGEEHVEAVPVCGGRGFAGSTHI